MSSCWSTLQASQGSEPAARAAPALGDPQTARFGDLVEPVDPDLGPGKRLGYAAPFVLEPQLLCGGESPGRRQFDVDGALGCDQLPQPLQQRDGVAADADVPVSQQRTAPAAGAWDRTEDRALD